MKAGQEGDLIFQDCEWLNEPERWSIEGGQLRVVTRPTSDFWQKTHYGFVRDSGHLFGMKVARDFTAQVHVQGDYQNLYDQAGMMVRIDDQTWLKTGIEVSDGDVMLGSVLTDGHSDWATGLWNNKGTGLWLRVTVSNSVIRIQSSTDGVRWPLLRLAPFPRVEHYWVGPMCCSPEGNALEVVFSDFDVTAAVGKDLHDLT